MTTPAFSIIIPVYNSELYLEKCLDSIWNQNYQDFEVILINDGSTDKSGAICDEYAKKDARFHVFHQKNEGVSSARNKGLSVARGKYISFVDSDDWVTADYLKAYIDARVPFDYDLVYVDMVLVEKSGESVPFCLKKAAAEIKNELTDILKFLLLDYEGFGYACNKSFKRELINRYNLRFDRNYSLTEDYLFTLDYCCYTQSVKLFPRQIYYYRQIDFSLSFKEMDFDMYCRLALDRCKKIKQLGNALDMNILDSLKKQYTVKIQQEAVLTIYRLGKSLNRKERLHYLETLSGRFGYGYTKKRILDFGLNLKKDSWADFFLYCVHFIGSIFFKRRNIIKLLVKK
ncbi:glycosyltransferase family 2 protein [Parabacteroides sp.]